MLFSLPSPFPPLPRSVSLAHSLRAEGLCADVPGEKPALLPWENMWSGSVYAGTLSTCLPHNMLASVFFKWQCTNLLSQKVKVTQGFAVIECTDRQDVQQVLKKKKADKFAGSKYVFQKSFKGALLKCMQCVAAKQLSYHYSISLQTFFVFIVKFHAWTEIKYACFKQTSRIFKHVFHRFSAYLTFSRVIRASGKYL